MNQMHMNGISMMTICIVGLLLFLLVLVAIVYTVIRAIVKKESKENTAIDILKTSYAKGEINEDEYRNRLNILKETN